LILFLIFGDYKASMLILGGDVADGGTITVRSGGIDEGLLVSAGAS